MMKTNQTPSRSIVLFSDVVLLASGLGGIWLAAALFLPRALYVIQQHHSEVHAYIQVAGHLHVWVYNMVMPMAIVGAALLVPALGAGRESKFWSRSRKALAVLGRFVAVLSILSLSISGMAYTLGGRDQLIETAAYKRALDQFALLEAVEDRFEMLRQSRDLRMVTIQNVSEFSEAETRTKVSSILKLLKTTTDEKIKRRLLSTLTLFRTDPSVNDYSAKEIPRYATEVGAPLFPSHRETFDWIASKQKEEGWETLPLFKFVSSEP